MSKSLTSLAKFAVLMALSLACMFALSACQSAGDTGDAQQSGDKAQTQTSVNIGTLATEDFCQCGRLSQISSLKRLDLR